LVKTLPCQSATDGPFFGLACLQSNLARAAKASQPGSLRMYYKLSALELEVLSRDRNKILKQFQINQVKSPLDYLVIRAKSKAVVTFTLCIV